MSPDHPFCSEHDSPMVLVPGRGSEPARWKCLHLMCRTWISTARFDEIIAKFPEASEVRVVHVTTYQPGRHRRRTFIIRGGREADR